MYVKRILLQNYRNYESLNLDLTRNVNIRCGLNAQGKTNLLEAIYFCATGRSHRTAYDKECIRAGEEEALIKILYEKHREDTIEIHLRKNGRKSVAVNGCPVKKIDDLFGCFHVVVFSPEDLSLIKSGPARRRKFMDIEICQLDRVYLHNLQQYHKVLKQRNQLLKDLYGNPSQRDSVFAWDTQLAEYGAKIAKRRKQFLQTLDSYTRDIHQQLSHGTEQLALSYEQDGEADSQSLLDRLTRGLQRDIRQGSTQIGPHRDDIRITINGTDVRVFGSQGQQRTAALSMKLAELNMVKNEIGYPPVLLLDDVMSELDSERQLHLVHYIEENQTILTCTGIEDSIKQMPAGRIYRVEQGQVRKEV